MSKIFANALEAAGLRAVVEVNGGYVPVDAGMPIRHDAVLVEDVVDAWGAVNVIHTALGAQYSKEKMQRVNAAADAAYTTEREEARRWAKDKIRAANHCMWKIAYYMNVYWTGRIDDVARTL